MFGSDSLRWMSAATVAPKPRPFASTSGQGRRGGVASVVASSTVPSNGCGVELAKPQARSTRVPAGRVGQDDLLLRVAAVGGPEVLAVGRQHRQHEVVGLAVTTGAQVIVVVSRAATRVVGPGRHDQLQRVVRRRGGVDAAVAGVRPGRAVPEKVALTVWPAGGRHGQRRGRGVGQRGRHEGGGDQAPQRDQGQDGAAAGKRHGGPLHVGGRDTVPGARSPAGRARKRGRPPSGDGGRADDLVAGEGFEPS